MGRTPHSIERCSLEVSEQTLTGEVRFSDVCCGVSTGIRNVYGTSVLRLSGTFKKRRDYRIYHTGMTTIASAYTNEGFAIGADSLRMDMHGQIVTESATKIFQSHHPDFIGAYGFSGTTGYDFIDKRPRLDVLEVAESIALELTSVRFQTAQEYAEMFCNKLAAKIQAHATGIAIPNDFRLCGMFVGYAGGRAFCLEMAFPIWNGYLGRPVFAEVIENPIDRYCVFGSEVVLNEMLELDGPETLQEAVAFVRDYITRCINNETDPYCAGIGGKPQIATVTKDGFTWVERAIE